MTQQPPEGFVLDQRGGNVALDLFVLDQHLGALLDAALAPTGVTAAAYAVYGQLVLDAATPTRLSQVLGIRPTTLSGYLAAMQRSGHVTRVRNERDGRSSLLELSESGRQKAEECRQVIQRVVRSIDAGIGTADEVRQVRDVLGRVDRAVLAAAASPAPVAQRSTAR